MKQKKIKSKGALSKLQQENIEAVAGWKERIASEMKKQGLSQRALASRAGLGPTSIRHILGEAQTISLESVLRVSNALHTPVGYIAANAAAKVEGISHEDLRSIKVIPVRHSDDELEGEPIRKDGSIALLSTDLPENVYALRISDAAMQPYGMNGTVPDELHLLKGDVVVWSPDLEPTPGELVIALLDDRFVVRLLTITDEGHYQLVSLNSAFPRRTVDATDLIGRVLKVERRL